MRNLSFINSNHQPIKLNLIDEKVKDKRKDNHQFHFETWWVHEIGCHEVLEAEWGKKDYGVRDCALKKLYHCI